MPDDPERIRRLVFRDGVCSRLMDTLTGGPFLAGLALLVGASNLILGLLAALPILAQVAQLPTLGLLLRVHDRRKVVVVTCFFGRSLLLGLALVLFAQPRLLSGAVLLTFFAVSALLAVTATAAWNWWMRDLLPPETLGHFFGRRLKANTVAALLALLAAGWVLDQFGHAGRASDGYALLFGLGALFGLAGLVFLARTPHPEPPPSPPARRSLHILNDTLKQPSTRRLSLAFAAVATSVTFALPFVAVFLLRSLGYSYVIVTALTALSQLAYIAGLRGWGHLSDNHGNRAVLLLSIGLLAVVQAGWAAAGWHPGWTMLAWAALLHFLAGYATGGVDLGGTNLLLRSAPREGAPAHLAAVSLGRALLAGLGTIAAGALWDLLGSGPLFTSGGWSLRGFQVLCLGGAGLCLLALLALDRVPEPAARPVVEVARAMRREVHQMSSVAGIRGLIHAVSYSVEFMAAPFAARRGRRP
jgi:MFS family permease